TQPFRGMSRPEAKTDDDRPRRQRLRLRLAVRPGNAQDSIDPLQVDGAVRHDNDRLRLRRGQSMYPDTGEVIAERPRGRPLPIDAGCLREQEALLRSTFLQPSFPRKREIQGNMRCLRPWVPAFAGTTKGSRSERILADCSTPRSRIGRFIQDSPHLPRQTPANIGGSTVAATLEARTVSIAIGRDWREVYDFVHRPENFPR